jgi:predicted SprT family Zn-dependent metalloprotease
MPCREVAEGMAHARPEAAIVALQALADALVAAWDAPLPPVRLRLSARLTRSAGLYHPPGAITISRHFLGQHGAAAAEAIVRHEVAHHVVRWTVPGRVRPHGREFEAVAARLGAPRHAPAFAAPRTVVVYRCPGCGWEWRRGRRIARGRHYACARCAPHYDDRYRLRYAGRWREAGPESGVRSPESRVQSRMGR